MQPKTITSEYQDKLPDFVIAKLFGLTQEEFKKLKHLPVEVSKDQNGEIKEFYIRISTDNPPELLDKLNLDSENYVRIKPEKVYKMLPFQK